MAYLSAGCCDGDGDDRPHSFSPVWDDREGKTEMKRVENGWKIIRLIASRRVQRGEMVDEASRTTRKKTYKCFN